MIDIACLRKEMDAFYIPLRHTTIRENAAYVAYRDRIWAEMDAFAKENPDMEPALLKAKLQEKVAATFEPAIFPHSPFFFEMGLRPAENWGTPSFDLGSWLLNRRWTEPEPLLKARSLMKLEEPWQLWLIWNAFDTDHHSLNYSKLL